MIDCVSSLGSAVVVGGLVHVMQPGYLDHHPIVMMVSWTGPSLIPRKCAFLIWHRDMSTMRYTWIDLLYFFNFFCACYNELHYVLMLMVFIY